MGKLESGTTLCSRLIPAGSKPGEEMILRERKQLCLSLNTQLAANSEIPESQKI